MILASFKSFSKNIFSTISSICVSSERLFLICSLHQIYLVCLLYMAGSLFYPLLGMRKKNNILLDLIIFLAEPCGYCIEKYLPLRRLPFFRSNRRNASYRTASARRRRKDMCLYYFLGALIFGVIISLILKLIYFLVRMLISILNMFNVPLHQIAQSLILI